MTWQPSSRDWNFDTRWRQSTIPYGLGGVGGQIGKLGEGKHQGGAWITGRRNKTRKLNTRLSLSLSFLPFHSTEANHPIRFSSFHLYIDFLPSRPFFSLGEACANLPIRAFRLSLARESCFFPVVRLYCTTLYSIIHRASQFSIVRTIKVTNRFGLHVRWKV